ncbi:MAG: oxygenase MpaB family protein [bacterium]|nr:oxygenase MpaB family protein [bacterium]
MNLAPGLRDRLAWAIRTVLSGSGTRKFAPTPGAATLLPSGGAAWLVHAEASMIVGGIRALLLQSLHPVAMQGVGEHSDFRSDPLGRLRRTVFFLGTTTYCPLAEAEAALEAVRRVHLGVSGITPDGRRYRADDADLLAWVHATEVDSFLEAYLRYGRRPRRGTAPAASHGGDAATGSDGDRRGGGGQDTEGGGMPAADRTDSRPPGAPPMNATEGAAVSPADLPDRYVAEMATVAERLGIDEPPRSQAELLAVIDGFRPAVAATDLSREATHFLRAFPLSPVARLAYRVLFWAAFDSLPPWAQALHDLRCGPLRRLGVRPTARTMLRLMGWALRDAPDPEPDESSGDTAATATPRTSGAS